MNQFLLYLPSILLLSPNHPNSSLLYTPPPTLHTPNKFLIATDSQHSAPNHIINEIRKLLFSLTDSSLKI